MKNKLFLVLCVILISGCSSFQKMSTPIPQMPTPLIPTLSLEEITSTLDANIAFYRSTINDLQEQKTDVLISISERTDFSVKSPDDKDKLRELYSKDVEISKQMAELTAPNGFEKVQEEFRLVYQYTKEYVDYEKALLIMIDPDTVNSMIAVGEIITEHSRLAFSYLKQ